MLKCTLLILGSTTLVSDGHLPPKEGLASEFNFSKQIVHPNFISEGVAVGDVDKDGLTDILSGHLWFKAPNWTPIEIRKSLTLDPTKEYSDTFLNYAMDVNLDGWIDLIRFGLPGEGVFWYKNPKGKREHWKEYLIDDNACNEVPMLIDLDDDGRMDLVFANEEERRMMWFRSPENGMDLSWERISISDKDAVGTGRYEHGLGYGDMNEDGRHDILTRHGWWEAPENRKHTPWKFHSASIGEDCSQMYCFDVDADGDNDVITSSAHRYGVWWHEKKEGDPEGQYVQHTIDSTFSQSHAAAFADLNNDGLPELITGKRYLAHLGNDPGSDGPQVIYLYSLKRTDSHVPRWKPQQIDNTSGVGLQVVVEDMDNNGLPDIVTSNKKGVFCFLQE